MGRPLKAKAEKVTKRIMVNLVEADYRRLMQSFDESLYPSKAAYFRARMVNQEVSVRTRNSSLDDLVPPLVEHNEELRRTGVNLNQLVHHLNTYKAPALQKEVLQLLIAIRKLAKIQQESQLILHQINEKWSQK